MKSYIMFLYGKLCWGVVGQHKQKIAFIKLRSYKLRKATFFYAMDSMGAMLPIAGQAKAAIIPLDIAKRI